jgi:hypothetical protein
MFSLILFITHQHMFEILCRVGSLLDIMAGEELSVDFDTGNCHEY